MVKALGIGLCNDQLKFVRWVAVYLIALSTSLLSSTVSAQGALDALRRADAKDDAGDTVGAIRELDEALKNYPRNSMLYGRRGMLKNSLRDH